MKILGIDPGSRITGYGCIEKTGNEIKLVAAGAIRTQAKPSATYPKGHLFQNKLLLIHNGINEIIEKHKPNIMVVEKVFFAKNPNSALVLGHTRGVLLLCAAKYGLELIEYSTKSVKSALTGIGSASKDDVSRMVSLFLKTHAFETNDVSDALALAVCHAHSSPTLAARGRVSSKNNSLAKALSHAINRKEGLV